MVQDIASRLPIFGSAHSRRRRNRRLRIPFRRVVFVPGSRAGGRLALFDDCRTRKAVSGAKHVAIEDRHPHRPTVLGGVREPGPLAGIAPPADGPDVSAGRLGSPAFAPRPRRDPDVDPLGPDSRRHPGEGPLVDRPERIRDGSLGSPRVRSRGQLDDDPEVLPRNRSGPAPAGARGRRRRRRTVGRRHRPLRLLNVAVHHGALVKAVEQATGCSVRRVTTPSTALGA